jgi:hypothetical protein
VPSNRVVLAGLFWSSLLSASLISATPAEAGWLSPLIAGSSEADRGDSLETALAQVGALVGPERARALAATISPEGHWTFVNSEGERLTAGNPDEIKRVPGLLLPGAAKDDRPLLYLAPTTVFENAAELTKLPWPADLRLAVDGKSYPLRRSRANKETYLADLRPNLAVELGDRDALSELQWQLARPVRTLRMRVVALEPGSAEVLSRIPRTDATSGLAFVDAVDPYRLARALPSVAGQTVVVAGRIDGRLIYFRPASGPEQSLILDDLLAAARGADVNLMVLNATAPQQPGGRSWLWQRVEIASLGQALDRATLADFLEALAGGHGRFRLAYSLDGDRLTLRALPGESGGMSPASGFGSLLSEVVAGITGKVVASGVEASLVSSTRLRELDARLVPGIPSTLQFTYLGLLLAGVLGLGAARNWWRRIWPPEQRRDYARLGGFIAARAARALCFLVLFLPAAGILAAVWSLVARIRAAVPRARMKPRESRDRTAQPT